MITKESPLEGMNMGTVATVAIRELPGLNTIELRSLMDLLNKLVKSENVVYG